MTFPNSLRTAFSEYPVVSIVSVATLLMIVAYLIVFSLTMGGDASGTLRNALTNCLPLALLGFGAIHVLQRFVIERPAHQQVPIHAVLAPVFAILWYISVIVLFGLQRGTLVEGFSVNPFRGAGFVWQMFQGVVLYTAVASAAFALHFRGKWLALSARLDARDARVEESETGETLILRDGDELRPVDISDIILVSGAGDYTEVSTAKKTHLSRKTLSEFEALLPAGRYVRVHRSRIVRVDAILGAEPEGGGRMTLQLDGGTHVSTSRAGARLLRERSI